MFAHGVAEYPICLRRAHFIGVVHRDDDATLDEEVEENQVVDESLRREQFCLLTECVSTLGGEGICEI